jgi:hypothetical protein
MGFIYFQRTQNITVSLAICIFSPFVINLLVVLLLKLWHKAVNKEAPIPMASSLMGSVFNVLWGGTYLSLLILLVGVAPLRLGWFERIQEDVLASTSYALINRLASGISAEGFNDIKKITDVFNDPARMEQYATTEEFKTLRSDERLQDLLADEETAAQIRDKDYGALLANPKMQAVFRDEELLSKIFALNKRIAEESLKEPPPTEPKVIEIE